MDRWWRGMGAGTISVHTRRAIDRDPGITTAHERGGWDDGVVPRGWCAAWGRHWQTAAAEAAVEAGAGAGRKARETNGSATCLCVVVDVLIGQRARAQQAHPSDPSGGQLHLMSSARRGDWRCDVRVVGILIRDSIITTIIIIILEYLS